MLQIFPLPAMLMLLLFAPFPLQENSAVLRCSESAAAAAAARPQPAPSPSPSPFPFPWIITPHSSSETEKHISEKPFVFIYALDLLPPTLNQMMLL
ncbi:hypothetical protein Sjap_016761 [Stephania japonica]|uniref:Secreted protein n=1 Tax=Stephania japonica TaxID=461633 RepID=A0AAP0NL62_9MAGN